MPYKSVVKASMELGAQVQQFGIGGFRNSKHREGFLCGSLKH